MSSVVQEAQAYLDAMLKPEHEPIVRVYFKKLSPTARLPEYKTHGAAGMDLFLDEDVFLPPGETKLAQTGISLEIPLGYEGQIRTRSSTGKMGVIIPNAPATIDSDYRGPLGILLHRLWTRTSESYMSGWHGREPLFKKGDRVAQLVICPISRAMIIEVDKLSETKRGEGGFGSTGKA